MSTVVFAEPVGLARVALLLRPDMIRATVRAGIVGAYCVYRQHTPVYVGRSDHCIRTRLLTHAASGFGTHFAWEKAPTASGAFLLESLWYHRLCELGSGLNILHPARPAAKVGITCPICDEQHHDALQRALLLCKRSKQIQKLCRGAGGPFTDSTNQFDQ